LLNATHLRGVFRLGLSKSILSWFLGMQLVCLFKRLVSDTVLKFLNSDYDI